MDTQENEATQGVAARLAAYNEVVKAAMDAEPRRGAPPCALVPSARASLFSPAGRILDKLCGGKAGASNDFDILAAQAVWKRQGPTPATSRKEHKSERPPGRGP